MRASSQTTANMPTLTTHAAPPAPAILSPTLEGVGALIEGRGTAVVLLHSSLSSKKQWRELIQQMRHSYRLIAIDLHGYGEAPPPRPERDFSLDDEVALVEAVLASALRADERFHLVGHSYGGVIALQLAQGQSRRVRSLTLFEPIPFHLLPDGNAVLPDLLSIRDEVDASLRGGDAMRGVARFVDYWSGAGAFSQMTLDRRVALSRLLPKMALELRAVERETLPRERYQRIVAPTCLITGRASPRAAHIATAALAGLLPQAKKIQIAAGHMAPVTHPALVNPVIERFIRAVDDRAPTYNFHSPGIAV
jgi:pimeloyl-ACP methyl ester carboxylesterase